MTFSRVNHHVISQIRWPW